MLRTTLNLLRCLRWWQRGRHTAAQWRDTAATATPPVAAAPNQLETFFDARRDGRGIWKWRHYFDIYHRHFAPLRHRPGLVVVEICVYSGGSLDMWRNYFGPSAQIYGIDIESACRAYEQPGTHILIGDQADPLFWRRVLGDGTLPAPDIVIDDGGHTPTQQRVTMEEVLPRIRPGGVYICEDVHGNLNAFGGMIGGWALAMNDVSHMQTDSADPDKRLVVPTNEVQATFDSIHVYPYVVVIEKRNRRLPELRAPKHGTQWEPFLR